MGRYSNKIKKDYVIINDCQIYRLIKNDHWLMLTPRYKGTNRYMSIEDMNDLLKLNKAKYLIKEHALAHVNKQFKAFTDTWEHDGKQYKVYDNNVLTFKENGNGDVTLKTHRFTYRYGSEEFFICSFQGHIYWASIMFDHYPRTLLYEFISMNDCPRNIVQWTNVSNLKPIYVRNEETNGWEMI